MAIVPIIGTMNKTISSKKYSKLVAWLKESRVEQGISMRALAEGLGVPHTFIQKIESLERRLDVYEYVLYCQALEIDAAEGLKTLE